MNNEVEKYHTVWLTHVNRMRSMLGKHLDKLNYEGGKALDWGSSFGVSSKEIADLLEGKTELLTKYKLFPTKLVLILKRNIRILKDSGYSSSQEYEDVASQVKNAIESIHKEDKDVLQGEQC